MAQKNKPAADLVLEKGLPSNLEAERWTLGAVMLDGKRFDEVRSALQPEDFSLNKHQRIFRAMDKLREAGEEINRLSVAQELMRRNELEAVDGLTYLVSLEEGLPAGLTITGLLSAVRESSALRKTIFASQNLINRCIAGERSKDLSNSAEEILLALGAPQTDAGPQTPEEILEDFPGGINTFLDPHSRKKGLETGFARLDELTGGLYPQDLVILAARPGVGKCLAGASLILQPDGSLKTISQMVQEREGRVVTLSETLKLSSGDPVDFVCSGVQDTVKLMTRSGRTITATASHPLLTLNGWVPLASLRKGDRIAVPRTLPFFGDSSFPEYAIKLVAYLLGDGGVKGGRVRFTNACPAVLKDFCDAVECFTGSQASLQQLRDTTPARTYGVRSDPEYVRRNREAFGVRFKSLVLRQHRSLRAFAASTGLSYGMIWLWAKGRCAPDDKDALAISDALCVLPSELCDDFRLIRANGRCSAHLWLDQIGLTGKGAWDKAVPEFVFRLPRGQMAIFLQRLFATDGWACVGAAGKREIGYCSVSERLARDVQHLLLRFGVLSRVTHKKTTCGDVRSRAWQVTIHDGPSLRTFAEDIGIFGKEESVLRVVSSIPAASCPNVDTIPVGIWQGIIAAKGAESMLSLGRRSGIKGWVNIHAGKRGLSRGRLLKLAKALDSARMCDIANSDVFWDEVSSVEPAGVQPVYDLTVADTHNFVANDVIVHNSALALNVAEHIAVKLEKTVMFFSLEMSKASLLSRLICGSARVDMQRFRLGYLDADDRYRLQKATSRIAGAKLYIDDKSASTLADLHAKVRRRMASGPVDLVIVDYLQLMSAGRTYENRNQEVTAISRGLKLMAAEINAPILALSQLSRAPELRKGGARPQLSDLRESGSLEQDASTVLFIFREEMYKSDRDDLHGKAELIIGKQRNGPTGTVKLVFLHHLTRFENAASDLEEVPPPTGDEE
jgi:replicative DNA helicase